MSMCRCDSCSRPIDSDDDPDCFIDTSPTTTACLCQGCREENEEETNNQTVCVRLDAFLGQEN